MNKIAILLIVLTCVLAGCTQSIEKEEATELKAPVMIEVEIQTPEEISIGEEVTIGAQVTQGDEKVEDANEVVFEIRHSGEDKGEMIEASHQGDGVYTIKKVFKEDGTYVVVAHVTARDMHHMPSKEMIISSK